MLEEMAAFFEKRLEGYEAHMLEAIEGATAFYPYTAALLPAEAGARVLDLGCGTGLELDWYFRRNPQARVTGIDLSQGMLDQLRAKHGHRALTLVQGSYFDVPLGEGCFDAAVSVESLHHFTQAEKIALYRRLHRALRPGGYLILTDYFAPTEVHEQRYREDLARLQADLPPEVHYHYDTPLTVCHETEALRQAGFTRVFRLAQWGATHTLRAVR